MVWFVIDQGKHEQMAEKKLYWYERRLAAVGGACPRFKRYFKHVRFYYHNKFYNIFIDTKSSFMPD